MLDYPLDEAKKLFKILMTARPLMCFYFGIIYTFEL